ncbi:hypothetical protein H8356DRAFT_1432119 [Neocallimastix lanati (nom. inval.)]|nr:hypothetical protein H8356DRAFT_1432119 [Neocallimastix sp. JGI-2020a]
MYISLKKETEEQQEKDKEKSNEGENNNISSQNNDIDEYTIFIEEQYKELFKKNADITHMEKCKFYNYGLFDNDYEKKYMHMYPYARNSLSILLRTNTTNDVHSDQKHYVLKEYCDEKV